MGWFEPERKHRRSMRLKGYDYSQEGAYFITACVQHRLCLFGEVRNGETELSDGGWVIEREWKTLAERFPGLEEDEYQVMPNHLHGILVITRPLPGAEDPREPRVLPACGRPRGTHAGSIGRVMQAFGTFSTYEYGFGVKHYGWAPYLGKLWQRNYYDHIIRSDEELERVRAYIRNNPARWALDPENTERDRTLLPDTWPFPEDL